MIEVRGVRKKYKKSDLYAVDNISFSIRGQEIFGLLGPNGAGKTTIMGIISSLIDPDSGTVEINGKDIAKNDKQLSGELSYVTQHISFRNDMTVSQIMEFSGRLYGMSKAEIRESTEVLLKYTGLYSKKDKLARELSGGMKRALMIARAILVRPSVLLLDEPTVGLDPFSRHHIWDLLKSLNAMGMMILITTHYIEEAENLCSRVALIDNGKLLDIDRPESMINKMGNFAVDLFDDVHTKTSFFISRKEALDYANKSERNFNLRRTSLEDVFIQRTGKGL